MNLSSKGHTIKEYHSFLQRFRHFTELKEDEKITEDKNGFTQLLRTYSTKKKEIKELLRPFADQYNVFEILGVQSLEVKTHSPFLANLLDPGNTHAQGDLFYQQFVKTLYKQFPGIHKKLSNINEGDLDVSMEKYTANGFIDIFIRHRNRNNPFCIIIENKIYAGDQYLQLERYYNYANNNLSFNEDDVFLIYLKDGSKASEDSMSIKLQENLIKKGNLINVSYSTDIADLLSLTLPKIKAPSVQQVVSQYINTIKGLNI